MNAWQRKEKAIFIYVYTSYDFDQLQTRHYEQRNKRSLETISVAENERKENCEIGKAFQNKWLSRSQTMKLLRKQWYGATVIIKEKKGSTLHIRKCYQYFFKWHCL